jgi:predicted flap endonuclease-1-like 5' DNA nuclease
MIDEMVKEEARSLKKKKEPKTRKKAKTMVQTKIIQNKVKLTRISGIGKQYADKLNAIGIESVVDLIKCDPEVIASKIEGIGKQSLVKWIEDGKRLMNDLS